MKSRFTPATEAALLAAGWFEGRTLTPEQMDDWLVINWISSKNQPPCGYSKISLAAWHFLREFGGLCVARSGSMNGEPLVINPIAVVDCHSLHYEQGLEFYSWRIGAELFPLGTIDFDIDLPQPTYRSTAIAMSGDGRFFLLPPDNSSDRKPICLLGDSVEAALEKLVAGDNGDPVDDSQIGLYYEIGQRIDTRVLERERQIMSGTWPDQTRIWCRSATDGFHAISDWAAEAAKLTKAFGIAQPCVFAGPNHDKFLRLASHSNLADDSEPELRDGLFLDVNYAPTGKFFRILDPTRKKSGNKRNSVIDASLYWDGGSWARKKTEAPTATAAALLLAKGLFNLGLLTSEIEAMLKMTVSQHEKLEWQLEFGAME